MGWWLKHGGYSPDWVLRLVCLERTRVVPAGDREYFQVSGSVKYLKGHLIHENLRGMDFWVAKHNRISQMAALRMPSPDERTPDEKLGEVEDYWRVWARDRIVERLPVFLQPFFLLLSLCVSSRYPGWKGRSRVLLPA